MKVNKLALSFGVLLIASTCFAQMYTITDLGTLGGTESFAFAINASGQVTGASSTILGRPDHAFLYSGGTMKDLGTLGGSSSSGQAINASGEVTGNSDTSERVTHGFLYSGDTMSDIGSLGGVYTLAYGINASGEITGQSNTSQGFAHAFLKSRGAMTDLGTLGGSYSVGRAVNDFGQVTGDSEYPGPTDGYQGVHAFLYGTGTMTDLGNLGAGDSNGFAINASGHVTGSAFTSEGLYHAFLYKDGVMNDLGACNNPWRVSNGNAINTFDQVTGVCSQSTPAQAAFLWTPGQGMVDLNTLLPPDSGWRLLTGAGINDAGQIVGSGKSPNGQYHAFLLSPVGAKLPTATTLVSSLNPSVYGQKVSLIAHVMASGPVPPTGMVVFMWKYFTETYKIGTATLNSAGVATLTKSNLNANLGISYPMSAVYRGDTNNLSSTSPVLNQTVLQTTSAATLTSSVNPSTVGQAITFTAKFTSPTVIPSGPVTFKAGTTVLGMAQLSGGRAIFTTSTLPAGSTVVKVIYKGNSNIKGSSASVTQMVHP